jgi:LEA14-like dessication related protein
MRTLDRARRLVAGAAALLAASCASMQAPSVTLSDLRFEKSTLFEQRMLTTLRVQNPNEFDLDVEGVAFDLEVNGQPFAKGVGKGHGVVPAYGSGLIEAEAIATLMGLVRQIETLTLPGGPKLSYRLAGRLKVRHRTFSIPFEMRGDDLLTFRRPS